MRGRLVALALACTFLSASTPARAAVVECHLAGRAGEFVVRKIVNPSLRQVDFTVSRPTGPSQIAVSDGKNHHLFVGFWLLRASDFLRMSSAFLDFPTTVGNGGVVVSYEGAQLIDRRIPSSNLLLDGDQGVIGFASELPAGTYYFVAFADGAGTFDIYTRMSDASGGPTCEPLPWVEGRIASFTALDFKGGTQVVGPGYGHAQNAKLSFTNPYPWSIGAVFAYEPAPAPPATLRVDTEFGSETYRQTKKTVMGDAKRWDWTASYTGKTNTILIELLQTNLAPTGY